VIAGRAPEPQAIEERYRRLVELSPDAVLLFHQDRIVFSNPAGVRLLGARNAQDLIGLPILKLIDSDFQGLASERLRKLAEQGGSVDLVHEKFVRLDGAELDVEVTSTALRFHQPGTGLIVFKPMGPGASSPAANDRELSGEVDLEPSPVVHSPAMHQALSMARQAAASDSTILLLGETGTGKELVADYIHRHSSRARGPLVKVNCAALPEPLAESELFGHEKGAFTGADRRRVGRFELAQRGTVLLDEVGELTPALQVKLLRVLQERTLERVGSGQSIAVNFRLVCATNRDLASRVAQGLFRADLYYRINVVPIRLPPLRERVEDIAPLARYFLGELRTTGRAASLAPDAFAAMNAYTWPGNVRELRNAVECALILCKGDAIHSSDLPSTVREGRGVHVALPAHSMGSGTLKDAVSAVEGDCIAKALEQSDWDVGAAARALGISRTRLYVRMKQYGLRR